MRLTTPGLADLLIDISVVAAQILIARLYFTHWKQHLSPRLASIVRGALFALWIAIGFSLLMRGAFFPYRLRFIPASYRSALSAVGNLYGITAVFCLAIYYVLRWFANRAEPAHS